jgi:hypothetical protein
MKKKTAFLIMTIVLIISAFVVLFFMFFEIDQEQNDFENRNDGIGQFFPTLPENQNNLEEENIINTKENFKSYNSIPKLRQIFKNPTAGHIIFDKESTIVTAVEEEDGENIEVVENTVNSHFRFVERSTGHIYETTNKTLDLKRMSNTSFPQIQQAFFSPNGENIILQSLEGGVIRTYVAKMIEPEGEEENLVGSLEGLFLPINSKNITVLDNNRFIYSFLMEDPQYLAINLIRESTFTNPRESINIFSTPLEAITLLAYDNFVNILTNPSSLFAGQYYRVRPNNVLEKIIGDKAGLNVLENEKYLVYSETDLINFPTRYVRKDTGEIKTLNLNTLPKDKCVFSTTSSDILYCAVPYLAERDTYPDIWYLGLTSFVDLVYKINLDTEQSTILLGEEIAETNKFDIVNIIISPEENYLNFINKKDLTLWSLDIAE